MKSFYLSVVKRMSLIVAFVVAGVLFASAENHKHTVKRGETLESIAQKYSTTPQAIINLNPDAAQFIYVGMELEIPQSTVTVADSNSSKKKNVFMTKADSETETTIEEKSHWSPLLIMEYGLLPKEKGVKNSNLGYAVSFGANYYFMESNRDEFGKGAFVGARIGYNNASFDKSQSKRVNGSYYYVNSESDSHFISVPVNLGYAITRTDGKFGVIPYVGMDFNFCVAGKAKYKEIIGGSTIENKSKLKKELAIDARVGLQVRIGGFNVGASYVMPVNKAQKGYFGDDSYLAFNIGIGF